MWFWIFMFICEVLIPVLMVIFGYVFIKHPPKDINGVYGYRTSKSMKSQEAWDFAHLYCGKLWLKSGRILLILSVVPMIFVIGKSENIIGIVSIILCIIQLGVMIGTIIPTEKALKQNFDEEGRWRRED